MRERLARAYPGRFTATTPRKETAVSMLPNFRVAGVKGFVTESSSVRGAFARHALRHIIATSELDSIRTQLILCSLWAEHHITALMFESVRSPEAREKAFVAALESRLDDTDVRDIRKFWRSIVEPIDDIRNQLCHRIWCRPLSGSGEAALVDASAYLEAVALVLQENHRFHRHNSRTAKKRLRELMREMDRHDVFDETEVEVFTISDVRVLAAEASAALDVARATAVLALVAGHGRQASQARSRLERALQTSPIPLHRSRLERLNKARQKARDEARRSGR